MQHTTEELHGIYAAKMKDWTDNRLRYELGFVADRTAEGNNAWASKEVMDAWNKAMAEEVTRRGLIV